jgi:SAM-dependent methyltransferase
VSGDRELWDQRYRSGSHANGEEPDWLAAWLPDLPRGGRALDVASGTGRVARWLARQGYAVTACDVSPVGLAVAKERATEAGLALRTVPVDLRAEPLPPGPWNVITCFGYLQRELFPAFAEALAPGGVLVYGTATVQNLERHARPPRRFLLEEGELPALVGSLEVIRYEEGWRDGSAIARILARRV